MRLPDSDLAKARSLLPRCLFQQAPGFSFTTVIVTTLTLLSRAILVLTETFFVVTLTYMVRPTMPTGEARQKLMQVRVQEREYEAYQDAAERAGVGLSEWVRGVLSRTAKRQKP